MDTILSKSNNISVRDVVENGPITYFPEYSAAKITLFVNDERTAIIRKVTDFETSGEPIVTYREIHKL